MRGVPTSDYVIKIARVFLLGKRNWNQFWRFRRPFSAFFEILESGITRNASVFSASWLFGVIFLQF